MYKQMANPDGTLIDSVMRMSDMAVIPFVDGNRDYEAYKQWLAEGNTPLPPDA
jgi:hypothetical protein